MKSAYQEFTKTVGHQLAALFCSQESALAQRARLLDADLAEIGRQISVVTTQAVLEHLRDEAVKKTAKPG